MIVGVAAVLSLARAAFAMEARFAVAIDYPMLEEAVRAHLAPGRAEGGVVWQGADGCQSVRLHDMHVERAGDRIRALARGTARTGFSFLRFCLLPVSWDGYLDAIATPNVEADWQLRFRDASFALLDRKRRRSVVASRVWDLIRGQIEPAVAGFTFDLRPPADEVRALIRSSVSAHRAAPVIAALDSIRPVATQVDDEGVKVDVLLDVPIRGPKEPAVSEPPLQPAELARWQATLESFDGFLVFVIKDFGLISSDPRLRDDLFALLLDSRQELLAALTEERRGAGDPIRRIFLTAWDRLRLVIRQAAVRGELKDRSLRYAIFVAAGDGLAALDTVGPWLGLEISADGLRRLARLLDPEYVGDPLVYSEVPDSALRELFGFHDPDAPPVPTQAEEPGAWWWPGPRAAHAEAEGAAGELAALVQRLDRWVPADEQLETYRDSVARLLDHIVARSFAANKVDDRFRELYGHLVRAVAWQESCWRQFVRRNGKVTYLLSGTGDIGIMQINRRVWRGFLDLEKLKWNVGYNVGAGAEILGQLLTRYGVREAEDRFDNAARATYCAYNGGPGSYRRYRQPRVPRAQRAIDQAFWEKYQAMVAGRGLDYVLCVEKWTGGSARVPIVPLASGTIRCRSSRRSAATRMSSSRHPLIASRPRASWV